MMKRYGICIVLAFATLSTTLGSDADRSLWVGLWKLTQESDTGSTTLHLFVPGEDKPVLYGSVWQVVPLSSIEFQSDAFVLKWDVGRGFIQTFRAKRTGERVTGKWELLHPQYHLENSFTGNRILKDAQWKPLQGLRDEPPPFFLDLGARLRDHKSDLKTYWEESLYPDFLPLFTEPPEPGRLTVIAEDPKLAERSSQFARIAGDFVERLKQKIPHADFPYHFVAVPFGPEQSAAIRVREYVFLVTNSVAEPIWRGSAPERQIPLGLLTASLEDYYSKVRSPVMDRFKAGLPLFLLGELYPGSVHEALGVSEGRLKEYQDNIAALKNRAIEGEKLSREEQRVLDYRFVHSLASSRPAPSLLRLSLKKIARGYEQFLAGKPARDAGDQVH